MKQHRVNSVSYAEKIIGQLGYEYFRNHILGGNIKRIITLENKRMSCLKGCCMEKVVLSSPEGGGCELHAGR